MFAKVLAHAKKEMPEFLIISTILWTIHIVRSWDGRITPITWLLAIGFTAVTTYVVISAASAAIKFAWSLIKRIPPRRTSTLLLLVAFIFAISFTEVAEANPKGELIKRAIGKVQVGSVVQPRQLRL